MYIDYFVIEYQNQAQAQGSQPLLGSFFITFLSKIKMVINDVNFT